MLRTTLALSLLASLASSQDVFRRTDPRTAPERILLIGVAAPAPVALRGFTGALGLADPRVAASGAGPTVSARLLELRYAPRPRYLPELCYQILSRNPSSVALSDVMRLPYGDEETSVVLKTAPPHPPMDGNDISYPTVASITMTLNTRPRHPVWFRHITFTDYRGDRKVVPIKFVPIGALTWQGSVDSSGLETLQSLADSGNRSHWDDMKLEHLTGHMVLDIASFTVRLHYAKSSSQESTGAYQETVPIIDSTMNLAFGPSHSSIDLDSFALATRKRFGGITESMHPVMQLVVQDFGKSGSDGEDNYGDNPKFRGTDDNECSEFVSWYYHEAGLVIDDEDFRDITSTSKMDPAFHRAGRRYDYKDGQRAWVLADGLALYTPQPGDFLARRFDGEYEHAMIVVGWNDATKVMTVINGPWPVALRDIPIQELEEEGYEFRVGRIR